MKTKAVLTDADVSKILAASKAHANTNNWAVTIAVVDDGGHLLGLQPGDRLALSLEAGGLRLVPEDREKSSLARALIGCAGYQGPPLSLEQMDPAFFAEP